MRLRRRPRASGTARVPRLLPALALGYFAMTGVTLIVNALSAPRVRRRQRNDVAPPSPRMPVVLLPARNEEDNLALTLPGLLGQGAADVVVLDDESTDRTAAVATALGARVIAGSAQPSAEGGERWSGKNWACAQLAREIIALDDDALVVFTDADVFWQPGALESLAQIAREQNADVLTAFPRQLTPSFAERLLTPLIEASVLLHAPLPLVNQHTPPVANGQVLAFTAGAYRALGGHAAVASVLVEDVTLARRALAAGFRVVVALGDRGIQVRMYRSYGEGARGLSRSLRGLHGGSRTALVGTAALMLACYTLPWFLPADRWVWLWRCGTLVQRTAANLVSGRRSPLDLLEGLLGPLTPLLALDLYRRALTGKIVWKDRPYA